MRSFTSIMLCAALAGCVSSYPRAPAVRTLEDGSSAGVIRVDSRPSGAWIFLDGRFEGSTPLDLEIRFSSATAYVDVVAVPPNDTQARRSRRIFVPPVPRTLFFDMNAPDASFGSP